MLATFRWWLGLLFLAGWLVIRPPLRRLLAERALLTRRATPALRHSWYYLGCAWRPQFAKEMRVFGLGDWILGRHQERWTHGMAPSWAAMSRLNRRVLALGGLVAVMYGAGTAALGLAAYRHEIGLGTLAVMLPMMAMTMRAGGVSAADVVLEQILALVWPPLLVVPLLAAAPGLADRRAGQIEKRNDDDLADSRRLLGELFSLASTAAPARELRTFGVTRALLDRHARLATRSTAKRCAPPGAPRSGSRRAGSCTPPGSRAPRWC